MDTPSSHSGSSGTARSSEPTSPASGASESLDRRAAPTSASPRVTPPPRTILQVENSSVILSADRQGQDQDHHGQVRQTAHHIETRRPHQHVGTIYSYRASRVINYRSFIGPEERMRAQVTILPPCGYRASGEKSGTLSLYQPPDCHAQNRDVDHLRLAEGNAFQNHAEFDAARDMVPQRIKRHYIPNKTLDPSPYVSAYGNEGKYKNLHFHQ
jgi:hypothetical protein